MSAVTSVVIAGMEMAKMWMDFSRRAADMTEAEANAEWQKVASRAKQAEERWRTSKTV